MPFQRVNDGVCDYELCCDGSDEWAHVGGTKCEDRCKEIGKQWRKQEEKRQKSMTAALKKKKELLIVAAKEEQEIKEKIAALEKEVQGAEANVQTLEASLKVVEEQERKVAPTKGQGKVGALAGLAKGRVDELREGLLEVRLQRDETRMRLKELEDILSKFKVEYNPNFNDEGVKRAVRSWEDYAAREIAESTGTSDADLDEIAKADGKDAGIDWEHWENQEDGCADSDFGKIHIHDSKLWVVMLTKTTVYKLAAYLPPFLVEFIEDKAISIKVFLEDTGFIAKSSSSTASESKVVTAARDALKAAEDSLRDVQKKIRNKRDDLEKDYGKSGIFRALQDTCISRDAGEYTYEHCFLSSTKQIQKKGHGSMSMGKFSRIGSTTVEELNEAGDIVTVEKVALEYEHGQHCWNGPNRSTKVILECGEENEILKTAEDEKCVYSMLVTTPAVCPGGEEDGNAASRKDEL